MRVARRVEPRRRGRGVGVGRPTPRPSPARPRTPDAISSPRAATAPSVCSPESRPRPTGCSAIVPTGAGNDFATTLGYDRKQPLDAIAAIAAGRDATVDLGIVNGRWYTCVTCSGFDAEANRWANTVTRLSGTPLYVAAVLRTLAVYKPCPFRVTVDGEVHETPAWMVAVGNSRAYAGGMQIVPDARMDDGLLDVCVIGDLSRLQILRHFPKVFKGAHLGVPGITTYRGARVTVEALGPRRQRWRSGPTANASARSRDHGTPVARALRVRVPQSSPIS